MDLTMPSLRKKAQKSPKIPYIMHRHFAQIGKGVGHQQRFQPEGREHQRIE